MVSVADFVLFGCGSPPVDYLEAFASEIRRDCGQYLKEGQDQFLVCRFALDPSLDAPCNRSCAVQRGAWSCGCFGPVFVSPSLREIMNWAVFPLDWYTFPVLTNEEMEGWA